LLTFSADQFVALDAEVIETGFSQEDLPLGYSNFFVESLYGLLIIHFIAPVENATSGQRPWSPCAPEVWEEA